MRLQLSTWPEVERYLEGSTGVVVPVGATEQHGPTGLVGTDAICAETLAWGVGDAAGALVAPTLSVGMSEHHMAFPGTVTLRPSTLLLVVRDVLLSLARHGFRRFFLVNGHGGNTPSLQAGCFELYGDAVTLLPGADLRCQVVPWWECAAATRLATELFGDREGWHASPSEVSLAAHAYPSELRRADFPPELQPATGVYGPLDYRRRYPDGRIASDPSLASVAHGETIFRAVVSDLAERYRAFVAEP
jgi:creatinine amidohydrolase